MSTTLDSLGLVVVNYRSSDELHNFLTSLSRSSVVPGEIVIVDNSPVESVIPAVKGLPQVSVIHRADNPGYGTAANVGVASFSNRCDWAVVCNPDIVVGPDTLGTLMKEAASRARAGSLGPAITNEDGSLYPSARALPTLGVGIGHALLGIVWASNPWTRAYRGDYRSQSTRDSGWLSGSFLLLNRKAYEEVGGFDEGYFMFFEDVDLGARLGQAGYENVYVPIAQATHLGGRSTKKNHKAMITAHHHSAMRFISKRYPGPLWWPLRALIGLGLTLRERILRARAFEA